MNASIEAMLLLANEELGKKNPTEACDRLINVLTAHIEISDILNSMEDATSKIDVYEATMDYAKEARAKNLQNLRESLDIESANPRYLDTETVYHDGDKTVTTFYREVLK